MWISKLVLIKIVNVFSVSEYLKIKIYLLYGCETWYLVLSENRLKLFEKKVLGGTYGPKEGKNAEESNLNSDILQDFHY